MPIGKNDWDAGRSPEKLESQILTFLKKNRPNAYTLSDIMSALAYRLRIDNVSNFLLGVGEIMLFNEAFKTLLNEGSIEAKIIKGNTDKTYYRAK